MQTLTNGGRTGLLESQVVLSTIRKIFCAPTMGYNCMGNVHYHIFPDNKMHHILSMKIMDWGAGGGGLSLGGDKVAEA